MPGGEAHSTESVVLTEAALLAAFRKLRDEEPRVCGVHFPHVVHPKARGWTNCAHCFGAVHIGE